MQFTDRASPLELVQKAFGGFGLDFGLPLGSKIQIRFRFGYFHPFYFHKPKLADFTYKIIDFPVNNLTASV
jgi:hypothetical protein